METPSRTEADMKAIEKLHQKDIAASKTYDVETLVSLWTDDVVALPPGLPPAKGKDRNQAGLISGRDQMMKYEVIEYDQHWEEVQILGDYAYEWGSFTGVMRLRTGGDLIRQNYKALRILKRMTDGSWKVHRTIWNDAPSK